VAGEVAAIAGNVTLPSPPDSALDLSGDVPQGPMPPKEVAFRRLRQRFLSWQSAQTRLLRDVQQTPRLSDAATRAAQLGELAGVGLSALAYLESHTAPPAGWQAQQMSILDVAAQPSALVRFTVLNSMRKLVVAAAQTSPAR
jgi:hexosaminidase